MSSSAVPILRAGVARVTITPPLGKHLQGFQPDRFAEGILDDLYAKALVLDDSTTRLALITVDLIGFEPESTARVRQLVEETTGIPGTHVMLCASHTHSGPAVLWRSLDPCDRQLLGVLEEQAASAVRLALAALQPVEMHLGEGSTPFSVNRRWVAEDGTVGTMRPNPAGANDRRARVLSFSPVEEPGGETHTGAAPLAVVLHAVCHTTSLGNQSRLYSGDYAATALAVIETVYQGTPCGGTMGLFVQGCCGNVRVNLAADDGLSFRQGFAPDTQRLGRMLGGQAVAAVESATPVRATPLGVAARSLVLPLAAPPSEAELRRWQENSAEWPRWTAPWPGRMLSVLEQTGELPTAEEAEVQAFRLGSVLVVALPGEPFVELGLAIERRLRMVLPDATVLVAGYANNECGYLCTARACQEGGYEPAQAFRFYGRPAPFSPAVEERVIDAGVALGHVLWEEAGG